MLSKYCWCLWFKWSVNSSSKDGSINGKQFQHFAFFCVVGVLQEGDQCNIDDVSIHKDENLALDHHHQLIDNVVTEMMSHTRLNICFSKRQDMILGNQNV